MLGSGWTLSDVLELRYALAPFLQCHSDPDSSRERNLLHFRDALPDTHHLTMNRYHMLLIQPAGQAISSEYQIHQRTEEGAQADEYKSNSTHTQRH